MTRMRVTGAFIVSFFLFLGGATADYFFGISAEQGNVFSRVIYLILPNWQSFWQAEALSVKVNIPWSYMVWTLIYMTAMIFFFSSMACMLFQNRELNQDIN